MARNDSNNSGKSRPAFRKNVDLPSKKMARTRHERISLRPNSTIGPGFFVMLGVALAGTVLMVLFGATITVVAGYASDLPPISNLTDRLTFKTTRIYDRNSTLLFEFYDRDGGKRTPIHLGDLPDHLLNATIATEDKDFYTNLGIDPVGIARAVANNFSKGKIVSGASTITQQLAKNVLLEEDERTEQSYGRKIREGLLAFQISQSYSKEKILEMYLNEIYYGHISYGIEAAADSYFGKSASHLSLAESAMLAGLPQAPSDYDPFTNLADAKVRQAHVLNRMVDQGYITPEEGEAAKSEKLAFREDPDVPLLAPHFVMYVRQLLEQKYGHNLVYRGGLKVTTTLDLRMNEQAEVAIRSHLETLKTQNANNSALVAIAPSTGEILTMVGSKDYRDKSVDGQVNVAVARRQPGSTIKPIVYLTAFSKGWAPSTIITDSYTQFPNGPGLPPYTPHNFDGRFDGAMTIRHALATSKNIPAVKTLMFDSIPDFLRMAESVGIRFENPTAYGLSLALGGGETRLLDMVGAYSVFDNDGRFLPPTAILKVEDAEGRIIEEYKPPEGRQVVSPQQAYMITSILSDNLARSPLQGFNSPLKLTRPAAAKTGSTDSYRDSWLMGYTPDLVAGVWVGNTDNSPMKEVTGSLGAAKIWNQFMEKVHEGKPVTGFVAPPGIREYTACKKPGQSPGSDCEELIVEVFPEGYQYVQVAEIPGMPTQVPPPSALGRTLNETGAPIQPLPTPAPVAVPAPEGQPGQPQAPPPARPGAPAPQPRQEAPPAEEPAAAEGPPPDSAPAPPPANAGG